jgi:hypothetical protein
MREPFSNVTLTKSLPHDLRLQRKDTASLDPVHSTVNEMEGRIMTISTDKRDDRSAFQPAYEDA